MLVLVQLDISEAKMELFDKYEAKVLPLLGSHGGKLLERLRAIDGRSEVHLLEFPNADALEAFCADPARTALQELWSRSGALADFTEVRRLGQS